MIQAALYEEKKIRVTCPECGETEGFRVDHLFGTPNKSFGPWACKNCGIWIKGVITSPTDVKIEILDTRHNVPGLMLVQVTYDGYEEPGKVPIYFVLERDIYYENLTETGEMVEDIHDFLVNEHSCPSNFLDVLAVIVGEEYDPHGILKHVQTIFKPKDFNSARLGDSYYDWGALFSKLPGQTIEGEVIALPLRLK